MAIEVRRRPYAYCFSGNPVYYQLYSSLAAGDATIFFEVKVLFKKILDSAYTEIVSQPYVTTAGYADVDISGILESVLEYELPSFPDDETVGIEAPKQTGNFYIQFREISVINTDPAWDNSENEYACICIKGGISYFKWRGNNFFVNYLANTKAFLTWQQSGRVASLKERMYLLWLNQSTTVASFFIRAACKVVYTDGSNSLVGGPGGFSLATGNVSYVPAGASQWGLPDLDTVKNIYYWEIAVYDYTNEDSPIAMSQIFRYYADNRNDYNDETLNYRNSLGGLDSSRVRGVIKYDLNYQFTEQDQATSPDYFVGNFISPRRIITNGKERRVSKGDIGYLNREEQDRFRDAHLQREVWQEKNKKWWPISLITETQTQKTTDDKLWSFPIIYAPAIDGDSYYTPESVDIGAGVFTDNVCLAYLFPVTIDIADGSAGNKQITVNATEVDPQLASEQFRYRVIRVSDNVQVIGWTTKNYTDLPLVFELPEEIDYSLEYQAICTNNVFGKKSSTAIALTGLGGGGGGGVSLNSGLLNFSGNSSHYVITVNGVTVKEGDVAAYETDIIFHADDVLDAEVVILISFTPSHAVLNVGSTLYEGSVGSGIVVFIDVDIIAGFQIRLF